jgi:hypothetical protein
MAANVADASAVGSGVGCSVASALWVGLVLLGINEGGEVRVPACDDEPPLSAQAATRSISAIAAVVDLRAVAPTIRRT